MMMQMLEAGCMPVLTDGVRAANEDNPRGYYEFEAVKKIREDAGWVAQARGKAVKMVSMLLRDLPSELNYRIIFMRRDLPEILASRRVMLERSGDVATRGIDEAVMAEKFGQHLSEVEASLAQQGNMEVLQVWYEGVLEDPLGQARAIASFLDGGLDAAAMAGACDARLCRQRERAA